MMSTTSDATIDGALTSSIHDKDYEPVLVYLHKPTGYYYNPITQEYLFPISGQQPSTSYTGADLHLTAIAEPASTSTNTPKFMKLSDSSDSVPQASNDDSEDELQKLLTLEKDFQDSKSKQSISSVLSAVSEKVMIRCGYQYDMDQRKSSQPMGLFYDQDTDLYLDPMNGCYYVYDSKQKCYHLHSQVNPVHIARPARKVERTEQQDCIIISSHSDSDSPEEGEILSPKLPSGPPPPEAEWPSCLRVVVTQSEHLDQGTVFIVTVAGANIGREPEGANAIKIPELSVSKTHATIHYSEAEECFILTDQGSVNGTLVNGKRLSQAKEVSAPVQVSHGDTLRVGGTVCLLHVHKGFETCNECQPVKQPTTGQMTNGSLDLQRRRELNRIKKKYGLRVRDTFGEQPPNEGKYEDKAEISRRQTVGSEPPDFIQPDDPPASIDRAIGEENIGHRMLVRMGWNEGSGLGKEEQGQINPVDAHIRDSKSGLGIEHSSCRFNPTDFNSNKMRKRLKMISRLT